MRVGHYGPVAFFGNVAAMIVAAAFAPTVVAQPTPTGLDVMERYQAQDRVRDSEVTMTMVLLDERGRDRQRTLHVWTRTDESGRRSQLIRFEEPGEVRGTAFLTVEVEDRDDDAWLYLPALRRTRRVAGAEKRDRFVGTDFTFEDLETEKLDEFRYELVGEEVIDGRRSWRVRATPTDPRRVEESAYGRRDLWIDQETAVLLRAEMYGHDGVFLRRMRAIEVARVPDSDKWRSYRLEMEDVIQRSRTVLEIDSYRIDQGVPADMFTERYLRRGS